MKLTNNYKRALGIVISPAVEAIVLEAGKSADITADDLKALKENKTTKKWLDDGIISVDGETAVDEDDDSDSEDPDGENDGETAVVKHLGGGHYNVFIGEEKLSEENLSKEDAEKLADEYNAKGDAE